MAPPPDYALRGLFESRTWLDTAAKASDNDAVLVSLSEHLHWLYAIGNWWEGQLTKAPYFKLRDADQGGRSAGALEWARGFSTHQLLEPGEERALAPSERLAPSENLYPGVFWRWRDLHPETDGHDRHQMYMERVAHRDLFGPLHAAARFLTQTVLPHDPGRGP